MGDKEADLTKDTTMASTTDFMRIVKGGSSRQISPSNFATNVLYDLLVALGFITTETGTYRPLISKVYADSPITLAVLTNEVLLANSTDGNIVVNLPAVSTCWDISDSEGYSFTVKKWDASAGNTVTVTPNGSETIDGSATHVLSGNAKPFATYICNGTSWSVVGG